MSAHAYRLPTRGVITVRGEDRTPWLDGMLSCNVKKLAAGGGAHGLLLTPQGRIVSELHVLHRGSEVWLETEAAAITRVIERLAKYVIADDVTLADESARWARIALEGASAHAVFAALGGVLPEAEHAVTALAIASGEVIAARYGFTGAPALQLFAPHASAEAVLGGLAAAGAPEGGAETFERLRIEAGTPWLGAELDESVLPAEARLDGIAVAIDKGCYTGQEVVARMRSRGRHSHLLVGLRFGGASLPALRSVLASERGEAGSVTSRAHSPRFGAIGLGYVQAALATPGTLLRTADGAEATIVALPFVGPEGA